LFEGLVKKVSNGGSGHWGTFPMPANDPTGKKKGQIEKMVEFVLSLG
jgi:cytochrome c